MLETTYSRSQGSLHFVEITNIGASEGYRIASCRWVFMEVLSYETNK
jgi:hypothetical protein